MEKQIVVDAGSPHTAPTGDADRGRLRVDARPPEGASGASRYLVSEGWGHLFGPSSHETVVRFCYDCSLRRITAMQASSPLQWTDCSTEEMADVTDSLHNANAEALASPAEWGLTAVGVDQLPAWVPRHVLV